MIGLFASRVQRRGAAAVVDLAFTDRHGGVSPPPFDSLDLGGAGAGDVQAGGVRSPRATATRSNFTLLAREFDVAGFVTMRQVHGNDVAEVEALGGPRPSCDGLISGTPGVALCVRAGDCVPVVLIDPDRGVIAVAHAGRMGVVAGVVAAVVHTMRERGADDIEAWIGPHICAGCYEVPAALRAEVAAVVPAAFACTTTGSPAVDIGAAVAVQLAQAGCEVHDEAVCTMESGDLYSYRRDRARSGRSAGIVVMRRESHG